MSGPTAARKEIDSLGEVDVPADKLWGAQTQRSLEHFSIGHDLIPRELIAAYATLKKAAANANRAAVSTPGPGPQVPASAAPASPRRPCEGPQGVGLSRVQYLPAPALERGQSYDDELVDLGIARHEPPSQRSGTRDVLGY